MRNSVIGLAVVATIAIGTAGAAMAQTCPPGQIWQAGLCRPAPGMAVAPPAPGMGTPRGTAAHAKNTMTPTPPPPRVATMPRAPAPVAGRAVHPGMTVSATKKTEVCPRGFVLYRGGCVAAQDYATAMFK